MAPGTAKTTALSNADRLPRFMASPEYGWIAQTGYRTQVPGSFQSSQDCTCEA
jgi:hypothetical protein